MLTIKHISLSGIEEIYQAPTIRFEPKGLSNGESGTDRGPSGASPARISLDSITMLHGGTVFVMNDTGKTIARYDLGASQVPIIGDGLNDPRGQSNSQSLNASRPINSAA